RRIEIHPEAFAAPTGQRPSKIGTSLVLQTAAIRRDGVAIASPARYEASAHDGHAVAEDGDVVEQLANTHLGLEQSWRFDEAPHGSGAIEVRVAAAGEPYLATTASGVHFQDPASGLGMLYSHAR